MTTLVLGRAHGQGGGCCERAPAENMPEERGASPRDCYSTRTDRVWVLHSRQAPPMLISRRIWYPARVPAGCGPCFFVGAETGPEARSRRWAGPRGPWGNTALAVVHPEVDDHRHVGGGQAHSSSNRVPSFGGGRSATDADVRRGGACVVGDLLAEAPACASKSSSVEEGYAHCGIMPRGSRCEGTSQP